MWRASLRLATPATPIISSRKPRPNTDTGQMLCRIFFSCILCLMNYIGRKKEELSHLDRRRTGHGSPGRRHPPIHPFLAEESRLFRGLYGRVGAGNRGEHSNLLGRERRITAAATVSSLRTYSAPYAPLQGRRWRLHFHCPVHGLAASPGVRIRCRL